MLGRVKENADFVDSNNTSSFAESSCVPGNNRCVSTRSFKRGFSTDGSRSETLVFGKSRRIVLAESFELELVPA